MEDDQQQFRLCQEERDVGRFQVPVKANGMLS